MKTRKSFVARASLGAASLLIASCATKDTHHSVVISVPEQRMALLEEGRLIASYPVSTSKYGLGDSPGSRRTPLGNLEIAQKIGGSAPSGAVFKNRRRTGEIVAPDSPGRDPIVSRILWLRGHDRQNAHAFARTIYIHGTAEERNVGLPVSYGCIRMRSRDVIKLYDAVGEGAQVTIANEPLSAFVPQLAAAGTAIAATSAGMSGAAAR